MTKRSFWNLDAGVILAAALLSVVFCADMLRDPENWGARDWPLFHFHVGGNYRAIVEFHEPPIWNPWYQGGFPMIGNPQVPSFNPCFLLDLMLGPVVAVKWKIVLHYAIGLIGMYWCARQLEMCRGASVYCAGTFMFSTWLALHLHSGHLTFLTAAYIPWIVGFLSRAQDDWPRSIYAGMFICLMVLEGGGAHMLPLLGFVAGPLALSWAVRRRSLQPLGVLVVSFAIGAGLSAVKLAPSISLLGRYPRQTSIGGNSWARYKTAVGISSSPDGIELSTPAQDAPQSSAHEALAPTYEPPIQTFGPDARPSRWDLPALLLKSFLGRDQESDTLYFPVQSYGWQEYGAYLGPLAIVLLAAALRLWRGVWPWMVVAAISLVTAAGNFAAFAPWTLMHGLPVLSNMRTPTRFLIPFLFAATVIASMSLHAFLSRMRVSSINTKENDPSMRGRRLPLRLAYVVIAVSLGDSFLVARHSITGTFQAEPRLLGHKLPAIVTVEQGELPGGLPSAMLANYSVVSGDEVIPFPARAAVRGGPGYRGETYFVNETDQDAETSSRVDLVDWSPCTARVRVEADGPGLVVLNRNFDQGWTTDAPYQAISHRGLIAARLQPGRHEVRFVYRPAIVKLGAALSLATGIGVAVFLGWRFRRRKPG